MSSRATSRPGLRTRTSSGRSCHFWMRAADHRRLGHGGSTDRRVLELDRRDPLAAPYRTPRPSPVGDRHQPLFIVAIRRVEQLGVQDPAAGPRSSAIHGPRTIRCPKATPSCGSRWPASSVIFISTRIGRPCRLRRQVEALLQVVSAVLGQQIADGGRAATFSVMPRHGRRMRRTASRTSRSSRAAPRSRR